MRKLKDIKRYNQYLIEKNYIEKIIKKKINKLKILDFGSADGQMLDAFEVDKKKTHCIENNKKYQKLGKCKGFKYFDNIDKIKNHKYELIIFRGSIQYISNAHEILEDLSKKVSKKSYIVFLMTPNSNSLVFSLFNDLNLLEFNKMYYIPNENSLTYFMKQLDFEKLDFSYPYLSSSYSNIFTDFLVFFINCFKVNINHEFSFPRKVFQAIYQKK